MKRRPITLLAAAAVAAALVSASWPAAARANGIVAGIASYRLTTTQDIPVPDPNANAPQMVAAVVPPDEADLLVAAAEVIGQPTASQWTRFAESAERYRGRLESSAGRFG